MDSVCLVNPKYSILFTGPSVFSAAIGTPYLLQIALNLNILFEHSISDISARKKA
jgi:hypothetical protein